MMECSEKILSGSGEMELDPNIVSEEAGKLYSELQVRHSILLCDIFFFLFCFANAIITNMSRTRFIILHRQS